MAQDKSFEERLRERDSEAFDVATEWATTKVGRTALTSCFVPRSHMPRIAIAGVARLSVGSPRVKYLSG